MDRELDRRGFLRLVGATGGVLAAGDLFTLMAHAAPAKETLVVAVDTTFGTLRPDFLGEITAYTLKRLLYGNLVMWGARQRPDGSLIYDSETVEHVLAESHRVSADRKTIDFVLRPSARFANGDRIDAQAVKAAYDWYFDLNGAGAGQLKVNGIPGKEHVVVVDERTLRLKLDRPVAWNVIGHAIILVAIVHAKEIRRHATPGDPHGAKWLETNTVSSGPYMIEEWRRGQSVTLKPNPHFPHPPHIKRVVLQIVPDQTTRRLLLERGEVDFATRIATKDIVQLKGRPGLKVLHYSSTDTYWLGMTWSRPPFTDPHVRRAIAWAVPYKDIIRVAVHGLADRARSTLPNNVEGYTEEFWPHETDLEKARQELARSRYPRGFEVAVPVTAGLPIEEEGSVLIQQALAPLGIRLKLQKMPRGQKFSLLVKRQVDMGIFRWQPWVADGGYWIHWAGLPKSFSNFFGYENPAAQVPGQEAITLPLGSRERLAKLREFQRVSCADIAHIPLATLFDNVAMRDSLEGYVYYIDAAEQLNRLRFRT
ncbi:MAG: ABC transporter substrate-binding protein [Deltaproteobacteria bacterium]|nr:ABC transporter substrate-binding protein [Deltaproteobacteria bacterium]